MYAGLRAVIISYCACEEGLAETLVRCNLTEPQHLKLASPSVLCQAQHHWLHLPCKQHSPANLRQRGFHYIGYTAYATTATTVQQPHPRGQGCSASTHNSLYRDTSLLQLQVSRQSPPTPFTHLSYLHPTQCVHTKHDPHA